MRNYQIRILKKNIVTLYIFNLEEYECVFL